MKIDRDLQRRALQACAEIYPTFADPMKLMAACEVEDHENFKANMAYLIEHGLLKGELRRFQSTEALLGNCVITAAGLDFLADDGGLTAILGTVTVKLHADTIRDMLLAKADASSLPSTEKSALRKQIESLPAATLQAVTSRLTQVGLEHVPDLVHWLRSFTGI